MFLKVNFLDSAIRWIRPIFILEGAVVQDVRNELRDVLK